MKSHLKTLLAAAGAVLLLALAASPALAADEHVFDAALSLTGACNNKSSLDEIEDPSCPYPSPAEGGPQAFNNACGVATDPKGYIYVASTRPIGGERIDVFAPDGTFLTKIEETPKQGCRLDVDSTGRIYVPDQSEPSRVVRYVPASYPPSPGAIYGPAEECAKGGFLSVAIDPTNDHLYLGGGSGVAEYNANCEFVETVASFFARDVDVWHAEFEGEEHFAIYVSKSEGKGNPGAVRIYDGEAPHELEQTISAVAVEEQVTLRILMLAVDQGNGDVYVSDVYHHPDAAVVQLCRDPETGGFGTEPCSIIEHSLNPSIDGADVAIDGSPESPNQGHLFVADRFNLYAFAPLEIGPPVVSEQAVAQVTTTTATLRGRVDPAGAETAYRFEYVEQAGFEASGFEDAVYVPVPDGQIEPDAPPTTVFEPIAGLEPGTAYRFRIVATNHCNPLDLEVECVTAGEGQPGEEGEAAGFATYPAPGPPLSCSNTPLSTGSSGDLPDCRAYELVTPVDTGGRVPTWSGGGDSSLVSPDGESLLFGSQNGALPGLGGNGNIDAYVAERAAAGWTSRDSGPSGTEARTPSPLFVTSDHQYATWLVAAGYGGSLDTDCSSHYLRRPDGGFELIGRGSLGDDVSAVIKWIAAGASHVIFQTGESTQACNPVQLEPEAPPDGVKAVYDRVPGGATHVVSLLPGEVTPSGHSGAIGASTDGSTVLFRTDSDPALYARIDNSHTVAVVGSSATFAGSSENGDRVFYLQGGDIFACDIGAAGCAGSEAHASLQIGSGGESQIVNISADGNRLYFVSGAVLTGTEENEAAEAAEAGEENLYLWEEEGETIRFVAGLDPEDLTGEVNLGEWINSNVGVPQHRNAALNPSRTTPDGSVAVFQSRAQLTEYDNAGFTQIYRYDAGNGSLICVSCNSTGVAAISDAKLQSLDLEDPDELAPLVTGAPVASLTEDGDRVFFESGDRLVLRDTDGLVDVYQWRAQGVGGCARLRGCIDLISGGPGPTRDYLYAVSPDGSDVFIHTVDTLAAQDIDGGVPSIYDARAGGGFPPPAPIPGECLGESCQPAAVAPDDPTPASSGFAGQGNVRPQPKVSRRCGKGKRKVRRQGRARCVRKRKQDKQRKRHHGRAHR